MELHKFHIIISFLADQVQTENSTVDSVCHLSSIKSILFTEALRCYNRLITDVLSCAFASAHSLAVIDMVFLWRPQLQFVSGSARIYFVSSMDKLQSSSVLFIRIFGSFSAVAYM